MNYLRRLVLVVAITAWLLPTVNAQSFLPFSAQLTNADPAVPSPSIVYNDKNTGLIPLSIPALNRKELLKPESCATGFDDFHFTGNTQNFVVPAGVTSITITAKGGDGGSATGGVVAFPGGGGGSVTATFSVNPGDNIRIIVGGIGGSGEDGGGGGGGTAVINSTTGTLLLVAGGGGGATNGASGGNASTTAGSGAGGSAGANAGGGGGGNNSAGQNSANGGSGGAQASITAISSGGIGADFGGNGGAGFGGGGGAFGSGGGGGGYTGGSSGNGGTNFVAGGATNVSNNAGVINSNNASSGRVRINYVCPGICVPNNPAPFAPGVHDFVVPADATSITLTARGGDGGSWTTTPIFLSNPGGAGGLVTATFNVSPSDNIKPGDNLRIIVGEAGIGGEDNGGGGGGTAIVNCGNPANCAAGTILLVAGGGGGGTFDGFGGSASTMQGNGDGGTANANTGGAGGGINSAGQNGAGFGGGQASKTGSSAGGAPEPNFFAGPGGSGFGGGGGGGGGTGGGGGYSGGNPRAGGTNFIGTGATNVSNGVGSLSIDGPSNGQVTLSYTCQLLCPNLTAAAPAVNVINSSCGANCTTTNGSISAPNSSCPSGSTLQYSTNNGANWSTTLPAYNQTTPITILTRCNCDVNTTISSPTTSVTTAPAGCALPTFLNLPNEIKACKFNDVAISALAFGMGTLSYQWQVSTDGGANFTNTGLNASVLQLNGVSLAMNGNRYRFIVSTQNGCSTTSNVVTLSVTNVLPTITGDPQNTTVCGGTTATFKVSATGSSYQWQEDSGNGFVDIFNNGINFFGANSADLLIINTPENFNGRRYRAIVRDGCSTTSEAATLTVTPRTPLNALNKTVCQNAIVNLISFQPEITNANGTFAYSFFGSPINDPTNFQISFNGLTVDVTFTDANTQCKSTTTIIFTVVQPTFLSVQNANICTGDNPFDLTSLEAAMTSESGTFEYFFNNIKIDDPTEFTAADGNVVNVTFTNQTGCQSTTTITFIVRTTPTVFAQTPVICVNDNPFNLTSLQSAITNNNFNGSFQYSLNSVAINDPDHFNAADGDEVQVQFTDFNGCSNTTTITFTVNPLPILMPQTANICAGGSFVDLTSLEPLITDAAGTFQYATINGQVPNPTVYFGNANNIVTVTFTDGGTGCKNTTTITFQTGEKAIATATDKMICSGASTALTVTNQNNFGGATFNWTANYNGATGGAGTDFFVPFGANAINETLSNPTNAAIDVVYTITPVVFSNGNCNGEPIMVTITVNPLPTASVSAGTSPICAGEDAVLNLSGTANAQVTYTINNGGNQTVNLNNSGEASVNVNGATTSQTLNLVSVRNTTTNCSQTLTGTATVIVNPLPTASVSAGTSPICAGENAVFNLSGTANAEVTYTINSGGNQTVNLNDSGEASVNVNGATTSQTLNLVSVRNTTTNCSQTLTGTATVVVNPLPMANVSAGTTPICAGENAIFNLSGTANAQVTYSINSGGNQTVTLNDSGEAIVTVNNATENQILALVSVRNTTTNCSQTLTGNATVVVNPLPMANVSAGTTPICAGENAVFNLSGTANAEVTYTINSGGNQTVTLNDSGQATVTINGAAANQTLNLVSVRNTTTNCSQALTGNATVVVNQPATVAAGTAQTICQTKTVNLVNIGASIGGGAKESIKISTCNSFFYCFPIILIGAGFLDYFGFCLYTGF